MSFYNFYGNCPPPSTTVLDEETKFVDQSEADRAGLKYQLERFGMDSLLQQFEKTKAEFGYADTRLVSDFAGLAQKYAEANEYFMALPSGIRKQFNHNPIDFYEYIEQEPNSAFKRGFISQDVAVAMGVVIPSETSDVVTPPDVTTQPVNPTPSQTE